MEMQTVERSLKLDNKLINVIYQHTTFLANHRYRLALQTIQTRHRGYEVEDFVQEVVQNIVEVIKDKTFPSINHLKKFIADAARFHCSTEKRKYFYTKKRGNFIEDSLDRIVDDNRQLLDTIYNEQDVCIDNLQLNQILNKRLCIVINGSKIDICSLRELKNFNKGLILSVNVFVRKMYELGNKNDVCKYFKDNGTYMSRKMFDNISKCLLKYCIDNNYIDSEYSYLLENSKSFI